MAASVAAGTAACWMEAAGRGSCSHFQLSENLCELRFSVWVLKRRKCLFFLERKPKRCAHTAADNKKRHILLSRLKTAAVFITQSSSKRWSQFAEVSPRTNTTRLISCKDVHAEQRPNSVACFFFFYCVFVTGRISYPLELEFSKKVTYEEEIL